MNRLVFVLYISFVAGCLELYAQRSIQAFPMEGAITVDGIHEPGLWVGADSAENFYQMEPRPGDPGSEPTVCYIGYDQEHVYISVNLYQESEVLAKVMNRDVLTKGDDCFALQTTLWGTIPDIFPRSGS